MVIVGSAPPSVTGRPGALLPTMTAMAPAVWALLTFGRTGRMPRIEEGDLPGHAAERLAPVVERRRDVAGGTGTPITPSFTSATSP